MAKRIDPRQIVQELLDANDQEALAEYARWTLKQAISAVEYYRADIRPAKAPRMSLRTALWMIKHSWVFKRPSPKSKTEPEPDPDPKPDSVSDPRPPPTQLELDTETETETDHGNETR